VIWIAFTHCLLRTAYTVASIPFSSLQACLTSDANERAQLAGFRMMGAASGVLTVAMLTPLVVANLGQGDEALGYVLAAMAAGMVAVMIFAFVVSVIRKPAETQDAPAPERMWKFIQSWLGEFGQVL
jgi:glycoside/pentoside/hexuronide:cation symporter, GPH family